MMYHLNDLLLLDISHNSHFPFLKKKNLLQLNIKNIVDIFAPTYFIHFLLISLE